MDTEKLFQQVMALPAETQMADKLREDRFFEKIPHEDIGEILSKSYHCGVALAEKVQLDFVGATVLDIINKLEITVEETALSTESRFFSIGYFEQPSKIVINSSLDEKQAFFDDLGIAAFSRDSRRQIILAHELFHYFQSQETDLFVDQYQIQLWQLGPYKHRTAIASLKEFAAMAFTEKLLGLAFFPGYFEELSAYPFYPEAIQQKLLRLL